MKSYDVLVTGGAGFVGRHLLEELERCGYTYISCDPKHGSEESTPIGVCKKSTFEDAKRELSSMGPFRAIVHLAANIEDLDARNKSGVRAFQDCVLDYEFAKWVEGHPPSEALVWMTSCATDTPELDSYGHVKLHGERLAMTLAKQGLPVKLLRPFSGYGHDQAKTYPFPAILHRALRHEAPLTVWGTGTQVRDFIHIDDLVEAILWAVEGNFISGVPIDIGTGQGTDFLTLARLMANAAGYNPEIHADPSKPTSSTRRVADTAFAKGCGWSSSISIEQGVQLAVDACTR